MKRTIVIVEDDRWLNDSYARIIRSGGYEVYTAADGDEAIEAIDEYKPDLILLDVLLRRTTGMALLHELQSHVDLAGIPIVIISSMAKRLEPSELKPYGIRAVLDKETTTPEDMLRIVKEALG